MESTEILLPKTAVIKHFGGSMAAVGRAFAATTHRGALTRVAVRNWPAMVPELRARQLLDAYPELAAFVLDPITRRRRARGTPQG